MGSTYVSTSSTFKAQLSREAHRIAADLDENVLEGIQERVDKTVACLCALAEAELSDIRLNLAELQEKPELT